MRKLEYARPGPPLTSAMRSAAFWLPVLLLSLVIAPVCLFWTVVSAGMGHGSYVPALIFFPFTMLSTRFFGSITPPFVLLAIVQFPIYGFILGYATIKRWAFRATLVLLVVHAVAVGITWGAMSYQPRSYVFLQAVRTGDAETVQRMLNNGVDPNTSNNSGDSTALDLACIEGRVEIAKLLIDKGADINHQDRYLRDTPLISATLFGREQCVRLLLSKGADAHRKDSGGYTALDRARQLKNPKIISLLEAAEGQDRSDTGEQSTPANSPNQNAVRIRTSGARQ